jgi:hypothetical protein
LQVQQQGHHPGGTHNPMIAPIDAKRCRESMRE